MKTYYVLFPNHTNGVRLKEILTRRNYKVTIAPTPRELSASCGISLLIREEDVAAIKAIIESEHIETSGIAYIEKATDSSED
ncbi:MAG: DUF3343 domain-containing protein [Anaerovoracaceae bacterium]|jgi:hypothetical protein